MNDIDRSKAPFVVFGEAVQEWLERAGQNQAGLAKIMGVDPSTITGWVRGRKRPYGRTLARLLAVLSQRADKRIRGWHLSEALDGMWGMGVDWCDAIATAEKYLQKGGPLSSSMRGGRLPSRSTPGTSSRRDPCCTSSVALKMS